jgi:hypothetical protein
MAFKVRNCDPLGVFGPEFECGWKYRSHVKVDPEAAVNVDFNIEVQGGLAKEPKTVANRMAISVSPRVARQHRIQSCSPARAARRSREIAVPIALDKIYSCK